MRQLSVYSGGAWKSVIVAYVYDVNSNYWKQLNELYVMRNGSWEKVQDTADLFVPSSATVLSLLRAAVGFPTQSAYWNTLISGRRLGDINNTGSVTSDDATIMLNYVADPSTVTALEREWVEREIIPYATSSPPP